MCMVCRTYLRMAFTDKHRIEKKYGGRKEAVIPFSSPMFSMKRSSYLYTSEIFVQRKNTIAYSSTHSSFI